MIASIWDLFHWGDKYLHTTYLHKTWRNPTADIYWSGALTVWQSVRITTVTKYNKRCSQAWFMSSAQGGRREIRQAEIVTRVWPHRNQSDWFQREDRKTYFQFITWKKWGGSDHADMWHGVCAFPRTEKQTFTFLLWFPWNYINQLVKLTASALHQTGSSKSKGRF